MILLIANACVFFGVAILIAALLTVRRLIKQLPNGLLRNRWLILTALIAFFVIGYLGYAWVFRVAHQQVLDLRCRE